MLLMKLRVKGPVWSLSVGFSSHKWCRVARLSSLVSFKSRATIDPLGNKLFGFLIVVMFVLSSFAHAMFPKLRFCFY